MYQWCPQPPELALCLAMFTVARPLTSADVHPPAPPKKHTHHTTTLQQIGGNVALALLLTVASNMLGVFTMPFMLPALLGPALGGGAVGLEPLPLLVKLIKSILLPTLAGAAVRSLVPGKCACTCASTRVAVTGLFLFAASASAILDCSSRLSLAGTPTSVTQAPPPRSTRAKRVCPMQLPSS